MDAQQQTRANELVEELANLLAEAENSDGSFKTFDQIELAANQVGDASGTTHPEASIVTGGTGVSAPQRIRRLTRLRGRERIEIRQQVTEYFQNLKLPEAAATLSWQMDQRDCSATRSTRRYSKTLVTARTGIL